jgi:MYXO-CTERM domain-containing protein
MKRWNIAALLALSAVAWSHGARAQTFTIINAESGATAIRALRPAGWWLSGFQLVDMDGDGDLDLSLGAHGGGNGLFATNDGKGHFTAIPDAPWSASEFHVVVDLDEDGKLDMVTTEGDGGGRWWMNQSTPGMINFKKSTVSDPQSRYQSLIDIDGDGKIDWLAMSNVGSIAPQGLRIYLGDGKGQLAMPKSITLGGEAAPLALDYDGDGDIDILMQAGNYPNDPAIPEHTRLYRNDGKMNFTDVTAEVGLDVMGLCILGQGDVDGDGDTDLIGIENRKFPMVIYINDHGHFTKKVGAVSGPTSGGASEGNAGLAVMTDLDNDGIGDILIAGVSWFHVLRGTGGGNFTYMNETWGGIYSGGQLPDSGFAFGDIDGDGDLDLIGYNFANANFKDLNVYRNDLPKQNWVKVRPVGLPGNKAATGAKIKVYAAGTQQLLWYEEVVNRAKQVLPSYYTFPETERHFGLGTHASVDVSVLFYPSNKLVKKDGVAANTTVRISEDGQGVIIVPPMSDAGSAPGTDAGSVVAGDASGPAMMGGEPNGSGGSSGAPGATDAATSPAASSTNERDTTGCQCRSGTTSKTSASPALLMLGIGGLVARLRRRKQ